MADTRLVGFGFGFLFFFVVAFLRVWGALAVFARHGPKSTALSTTWEPCYTVEYHRCTCFHPALGPVVFYKEAVVKERLQRKLSWSSALHRAPQDTIDSRRATLPLFAWRMTQHDPCVRVPCDLVCPSALGRCRNGDVSSLLTSPCGARAPLARRPSLPTHQTMSAQPALVSRATFTKEKIALLCLMNMVFERHSQDRNIPFEEIAARTKLPVDQVQ